MQSVRIKRLGYGDNITTIWVWLYEDQPQKLDYLGAVTRIPGQSEKLTPDKVKWAVMAGDKQVELSEKAAISALVEMKTGKTIKK